MNKHKSKLKDKEFIEKFNNDAMNRKSIIFDIISVLLGIAILILIILMCINPNNVIIITAVFILAGCINLFNGIKLFNQKEKRNTAMILITMGIVIFFIGFYYIFQKS